MTRIRKADLLPQVEQWDDQELAEIYPEGRHLYFEGALEDISAFIEWLRKRTDHEPTLMFFCPSEALGQLYRSEWEFGS